MRQKAIYIITAFFIFLNTYGLYANETKTNILIKELETLNIDNPKNDLTNKIDINDFRFIGLYGYALYFPGIDEENYEFVKRYGSIMFEGTGDVIESEEHVNLILSAKNYALTYNTALLTFLKRHNVKPKEGYVPDKETAIKIAIAVWTAIYGEEQIDKQKPYNAILENGIWIVCGSLPQGHSIGGVAEAEIIKENGKIIRVSHGE